MDDLFKKFEDKMTAEFAKFEASPVKTGIKWLVIYYLLKKAYAWVKEN